MKRFRDAVDKILAWFLIALMGIAVLNVLWQVFTRWALQDPSSYTEELARYLLIWIGLLGSAYAVGKKLHLAIDLVPMKLEGRARRWLEIAIQLLIFAFALAVLVGGGIRLVVLMLRFGQVSAALGVPLGIVYLVLPLSGLLIMLYSGVEIGEQVAGLRGKAVAEPTPEQKPPPAAI